MVQGRKKKVTPPLPPMRHPRKPDDLNENGSAFWDRLIAVLHGLTEADQEAMTVVCRQYEMLCDARAELAANGSYYTSGEMVRMNPAVKVAQEQLRAVMRSLSILGATPYGRKQLHGQDHAKTEDPFEGFLQIA